MHARAPPLPSCFVSCMLIVRSVFFCKLLCVITSSLLSIVRVRSWRRNRTRRGAHHPTQHSPTCKAPHVELAPWPHLRPQTTSVTIFTHPRPLLIIFIIHFLYFSTFQFISIRLCFPSSLSVSRECTIFLLDFTCECATRCLVVGAQVEIESTV